MPSKRRPQPHRARWRSVKTLNDKIVVLVGRLPESGLTRAPPHANRKALLRCLVEKVVLDRGEHDVARVRIVWRGGAVSELDVKMRVNSVARLTRGEEMRTALIDLARTGMPDDEIAAILTPRGIAHRTAPRMSCPITVQRIRLAPASRGSSSDGPAGTMLPTCSAPGARRHAEHPCELALRPDQAKASPDRSPSFRRHLFANTPSVIDAVRNLRNHAVDHLDFRICQPHKEGHSTWVVAGRHRLANSSTHVAADGRGVVAKQVDESACAAPPTFPTTSMS